jgi:hypothetical protein
MKISGNNEIIKSIYPDKSQRSEQTSNTDFKNILKESVEKSAQHATQIQSPSLLNPLSAVRFDPESPQDKISAIKQVDSLLNLLDDYRKQLADPAITLRSIEPMMKTIIKEKDQLSSLLDSLPNEDGLKDIANRTLITASLEVIKYNRGDYITS